MPYKVGYKDKDNNFLCMRIFDTHDEAEYHREMWQDTEDQYGDHTRYLDGDYYGEDEIIHTEYIILKE